MTALPEDLATSQDAPYLQGLNDPQRKAVETVDGPLLVLAGAGTGKTRVLTTRIAHILLTRRAWPSQILAVTFTNKAAGEMRDRVATAIGTPVEGMWIGTFHAMGARILRRHAELVGLKSGFTILDTDDQTRLVKQILEAENIDIKRWPPRVVLGAISRFKDRGLLPDQVRPSEAEDLANGRLVSCYRQYQDRLKSFNAADFGDLLLHCLTIFTAHDEILSTYQDRFKYILVDEYQDTNVAQYLWLRLLAQGRNNICCVGDDDQAIYSWRGAEVGNILRFEKDFSDARIVRLEQNYRSTQPILAAASSMIARNRGRLGKTLWTSVESGSPVEVHAILDGEDEARFVCDRIEELWREDVPLTAIAILVRASFQMRQLEERLVALGIPYRVVGGLRFYERREIRDAVAYMRATVHPDDGMAFERIINVPNRGLGAVTVRTLQEYSRAASVSLHEAALRLLETDELRPRARSALRRLTTDFDRWRTQLESMSHSDLVAQILEESGYVDMWLQSKELGAEARLENLKELVAGVAKFESLPGFLEHISLVMDHDERPEQAQVSLMTLHAAKGLEFDNVFLPGWEEEIFPAGRALNEGGNASLEEERRLAYVGLTRARKRVWISWASTRFFHGSRLVSRPSRFIDEIASEHLLHVTDRLPGLRTFRPERDPLLDTDFQRLKTRRRLERQPPARTMAAATAVKVGTRIFHQKFGYGEVRSREGGKLRVDFEKAGTKMIMEQFVKPA